jgi:hypothetical protein
MSSLSLSAITSLDTPRSSTVFDEIDRMCKCVMCYLCLCVYISHRRLTTINDKMAIPCSIVVVGINNSRSRSNMRIKSWCGKKGASRGRGGGGNVDAIDDDGDDEQAEEEVVEERGRYRRR